MTMTMIIERERGGSGCNADHLQVAVRDHVQHRQLRSLEKLRNPE